MVVAVMVSMVAFLDSTVINVALPDIEHDLGGGLALTEQSLRSNRSRAALTRVKYEAG
jgi:hypothetical protein